MDPRLEIVQVAINKRFRDFYFSLAWFSCYAAKAAVNYAIKGEVA